MDLESIWLIFSLLFKNQLAKQNTQCMKTKPSPNNLGYVYNTFFSNGILRKTKYVAAKHNGMQITQRRSHFATGYNTSEFNKIETGMMIIG